ncbi:MAG: hypothetical protein JWO32_2629 [Bacteroidetes bacterium]|nr:hypothetical protein [Bacteroidota bacterium]
MKKSRTLILSLFILCFSIHIIKGQSSSTYKNSFIIHGSSLSQSDKDFYKKSIEAADFEQFRLQTQTVVLKFKNGFTLELIPAKDLVIKNIVPMLDINKYTNFPAEAGYKYPLFEVLSTGWITAAVEPTNTKATK